jgi:hypothetical protein
MNTSKMPVSAKSISVVRSVALLTGFSPRAANTAKAGGQHGAAYAETQRVDAGCAGDLTVTLMALMMACSM